MYVVIVDEDFLSFHRNTPELILDNNNWKRSPSKRSTDANIKIHENYIHWDKISYVTL